MTNQIAKAAQARLNMWQQAFNTGDAAGCADCYEEQAVMVAKPFGEFKGRAAIQAFWANLIEQGFTDVSYTDSKIDVISETEAVISASWRMNKAHGIITKELWVLQSDGSALLREDHFEALG